MVNEARLEKLCLQRVSQRRNPLIADLFRRISMVEAWGCGMPLILKHAPDAEFREVGNLFIAAFHRPSFLEQEVEGEGATQETTQERPSITKEKPKRKLYIFRRNSPPLASGNLPRGAALALTARSIISKS